ncbi:MAG: hypothetical protein KAH34_02365 [Ketobacter sp.]|nr:hypothetical protein [Ketobacter sp.]
MLNKFTMFAVLSLLSLTCVSAPADKAMELGYYRALFLNQEYAKLEQAQQAINTAYSKGEITWQQFYPAFDWVWFERDLDSPAVEQQIKAIEAIPQKSALTQLLLGSYYFQRGSHRRGGKWINKTPQSNIQAMWADYNIAIDYCKQAIAVQPDLIHGYRTLINIYKNDSQDNAQHLIKQQARKAQQVKADSYVLWHAVLTAQLPRWGGSYQAMQSTLLNIKPLFKPDDKNYQMLKGMIANDKADRLIRDKKYAEASKLLQRYEFTGYPYLLVKQARLHKKDKRYQQCVDYAQQGLQSYPYYAYGLKQYAYCADQLERWDDAREAFHQYALLEGNGAWQLFYLGKAYMFLLQYEKAYPLLKESVRLKPDYRQYTQRYTHYIETQHPELTHATLQDLGL